MSNNFLKTQINFKQENHCSVFFAHLQNILKKFIQTTTLSASDTLQVDKILHVLNDIYCQHQKLEVSYEQLSKSTKDMMAQFSSMLHECKDDREKLMEATKDRYDMIQKLKEYNESAMDLEVENRILKETVEKMKEINELLMEKNSAVEDQLANRKVAELGTENYARIAKQYQRLLQSNTQIRKQLVKICAQSESIERISRPLQVINKALKVDPTIKQKIWQIALQQGKNQKQYAGYEKQFYQFNFDQFIKEIKEQSK